MDCPLLYRAGLGSVCLCCDVLGTKMAPGDNDQPVSGLHGDHQLWAVLAAQNPFRFGANTPSGAEPISATAHHFRYEFCPRGALLESARKTIPQTKTILRFEA